VTGIRAPGALAVAGPAPRAERRPVGGRVSVERMGVGDVDRRDGGDHGQSSAGVLGGGHSAGSVLQGAPRRHGEAEAVLRGGCCESKRRGTLVYQC